MIVIAVHWIAIILQLTVANCFLLQFLSRMTKVFLMRFRQSFMICHEKNIFIQKKYTGRLSKHSNGLPMKPQVNINICRDYILQCVSINAFKRSGYALIKHPSLKGKIQIIIYEHLDSEQAYEQLDDLFNKRLSVSPQCCCFIFDNVILYFIILIIL